MVQKIRSFIYKERVYSLQFWLMCLSSLLFFASFNMLIPELPSFLTSLGGGEYKGYIIALFTLTAGVSRPFSGKLADTIGRVPVIMLGSIVTMLCGLFYPFVLSVLGFFALRFFHGFSTGFQPTGTSAYVADIIPIHRRGEAMGIIGVATSTGMAAGPALGSWVALHFGVEIMFYVSSFVALMAVLLLFRLRETLDSPLKFRFSLLKINRHEIIENRVLIPSFILILTIFAFGTVLTVVPDFTESLGFKNKGIFFTCFTLTSLGIRIVAGRVSDKYGRVVVLKVSTLVLAASMLALGLSTSKEMFYFSAYLFGVAVGINSPTIYAWTIDMSDPARRGRGLATMYIALEIGIGTGALLSGWIFGNDFTRISYPFFLAAGLSLLASICLWLMYPGFYKRDFTSG